MTASFSLQEYNAKSDYTHNTLIRWTVISTELVLLWWWLYSYNYFLEYNYPSLLCRRCKEDVGCVYTISPLNHSALKSLKTNPRGLIMKPSWWSFTWRVNLWGWDYECRQIFHSSAAAMVLLCVLVNSLRAGRWSLPMFELEKFGKVWLNFKKLLKKPSTSNVVQALCALNTSVTRLGEHGHEGARRTFNDPLLRQHLEHGGLTSNTGHQTRGKPRLKNTGELNEENWNRWGVIKHRRRLIN